MFSNVISAGITPSSFLLCTGASLILGLLLSAIFSFRAAFSRSFSVTLALLPSVIQLIIMMVSGSIGAGVAVAGTFSLIRFRSEAGTARQLTAVFIAVALGIAVGMGYVALAAVFLLITGAFYIALSALPMGSDSAAERELRVTIPESLDYEGVFDDLFQKYTVRNELQRVKTTNMGTMYELTWHVVLRNPAELKAFMDQLRTRNGNLTILCGRISGESRL